MSFVKLDCGILQSTLWVDKEARDVFITALLMAHPFEVVEPMPQVQVRSLSETGWSVPPGWYGFVPSSGCGILRQAGGETEVGMAALERLGAPDQESRSIDHDGRRLVRVDGGFIVLNYIKYRDRDHTAAQRMKRLRERKKQPNVRRNVTRVRRNVTHSREQIAEADSREQTLSLEPIVPEQQQLEAPAALAIVNTKISISDLNVRFTGCFNAVFDRRCSVQPALEALLRKRCRDGDHRAWQIIASPILAAARQREVKSPAILLRDGKHPRTNGSGVTSGATDWLLWLYSEADQVVLDPRLASIAAAYDVLDRLKKMNIGVRQESGL